MSKYLDYEGLQYYTTKVRGTINTVEKMNGAKNYIITNPLSKWSLPSGLTITQNSEGAYVLNGTITSGYKYIFIGYFYYGANTYYMTQSSQKGAYAYTEDSYLYSSLQSNHTYTESGSVRVYIRVGKSLESITFDNDILKPMIISKDVYDAGFMEYQPYAMTNYELTNNVATNLEIDNIWNGT